MTSSDALDDDTLSHDHSLVVRSPSPDVTPQPALWDLAIFPVSPVRDFDMEGDCYSLSDGKTILEDRYVGDTIEHEDLSDTTTGYENTSQVSSTRQKKSRENSPIVLCFGAEQDDNLDLDWDSDFVDSQEDIWVYGGEADFEELNASTGEESPIEMDIEDMELCSVHEDQVLELGDEVEVGFGFGHGE
ncbi:hypothetical protein L218DRAFT_965297 [Marasmius fiardii PR-910]|nr:hypothetical protein L218DRAFT_965297 [Marasmius fiardii PR-910]